VGVNASRWIVGSVLALAASVGAVAACGGVASAADVVPAAPGPTASAGGGSPGNTEPPRPGPQPPPTATATGPASLPQGVPDGRGEVEIRGLGFSVNGQYAVRPDLGLTWAISADRSHYDFSDPDAVVAGSRSLFSDGNVLSVSPGFVWEKSHDTRISATLTVK